MTLLFESVVNAPARVKAVVPPASVECVTKKPWPESARSSVRSEVWKLPCVNCCWMPCSRVPRPGVVRVDWSVEAATTSPNVARPFLNPMLPTLAMLFETTERSVCAALRPLSEV